MTTLTKEQSDDVPGEIGRVITRNAMFCDGTHRREQGYRAHIERLVLRSDQPTYWRPGKRCIKQFAISPLFKTELEAIEWQPK